LESLIRNVLDIPKIESKRIDIKPSIANLNTFLTEIWEMSKPMLKAQKIEGIMQLCDDIKSNKKYLFDT